MVGDTIRKHRDLFSFGLLAVAVLYVVSGLSLLVKSEDDSLLTFSGRAAYNGYLFTHPFVIISLAVAVALAIGLGEPSANARGVVLSALGVGGIAMLLGLVSWIAAFNYDGSGFGGVLVAGKIVSILLGLAQLIAMGLTLFFALVAWQALPKKAPQAQHWGGAPGYGQQWGQPDASQWGQHAAGAPQWGQQAPPQQPWGQPPADPQQQWGQHAPPQQPWGQPPADPQQQWGQHAPPQPWGQPQPEQQSWGQPEQPQPEQQSWGQPEQPQPEQQSWGQPEQPRPEQQSWGQPEQPQPEQQSWGQPAGQEAQAWGSDALPDVESTTVSDALPPQSEGSDNDQPSVDPDTPAATPADPSDETAESSESQQDGWWQRPST